MVEAVLAIFGAWVLVGMVAAALLVAARSRIEHHRARSVSETMTDIASDETQEPLRQLSLR